MRGGPTDLLLLPSWFDLVVNGKIAAIRSYRPACLGSRQIAIDGRVKVGLKLFHRVAVKGNYVVNILDAPNNDLVLRIEDHARRVALVRHEIDHGLIPIRSMNSGTAETR